MTAADSLHSTRRSASNNTLHRLERINQNILSLKTKLSSYICEPKTLVLYQKLESLRFQLEDMSRHNQELMKRLYDKSPAREESGNLVQQQFKSYKELELKVLEYIGMAKLHC